MATNRPPGNLSNDVQINDPPTDSISSLGWSRNSDYLVSSSWDGLVRIWQVDGRAQSKGVAEIRSEKPVLSAVWSHDGTRVAYGGTDGAVRVWQVNGSPMQIGSHDAPVKSVRWIHDASSGREAVLSGSWDHTARLWDTRSQQSQATIPCGERVFAMDFRLSLIAVATAERNILVYDLRNLSKPYWSGQSALRFQLRDISIAPNDSSLVTGSIEGRVAVRQNIASDVPNDPKNYTFRCHRDGDDIYAVNCVAYHPIRHSVVASCGSDGLFAIWDIAAKSRIRDFPRQDTPITCAQFSPNGALFAYALSYDWSKGVEGRQNNMQNVIKLHPVTDDEVTPRVVRK